jgi:TadE-like protein
VTPGSISIPCRVVRHDQDGVGVIFMLHSSEDRKALERFMRHVVRRPRRRSALGLGLAAEGQALVEFALMVPLLFVLIVNAVNFGGYIYDWITVANAARAGAQYAAMGAAYAGYPPAARLSNITTLIQNETAALPNASGSNPVITVCEFNGSAIAFPLTTPTTACSDPAGVAAPPQDPETITGGAGASHFTTLAIDLTYTYSAFIPTFNFRLFGIILPTTNIHSRIVMRVLN